MRIKNSFRAVWFSGLGGFLAMLAAGHAADWPQYRGPHNDSSSEEKMLAAWPLEGPRLLWKGNAKDAFGSFAIVGDHAYYLSTTNVAEACFAVELKTGRPLWATILDRTILQSTGGTGPRTTPTVDGDRIYTYGTYMKLHCLNASDGKIIWQQDIGREFGGQLNATFIARYGAGCSPIVEGRLVIVQGGGAGRSFMAFDKTTGQLVWKNGSDVVTHATPTPATIGGVRQVIFFMQSGLVSLNVTNGAILWRHPFASEWPIAASPVVSGDIVYGSAGYGLGALACRITRSGNQFRVEELWRTAGLNMNHYSTPVVKDGFLYGLYGSMMENSAPLQCLELATGAVKWTGPVFGEGQVILVDGKLIVQGSRGELALIDPNPNGYREISRAQVIAGRAWGMPAFGNGVFLHRTDHQIAALDMGAK